jgi:hypothetical protein
MRSEMSPSEVINAELGLLAPCQHMVVLINNKTVQCTVQIIDHVMVSRLRTTMSSFKVVSRDMMSEVLYVQQSISDDSTDGLWVSIRRQWTMPLGQS